MYPRTCRVAWHTLVLFSLAGCASTGVILSPNARTIPGSMSVAMVEQAAVRVMLEPTAWAGTPAVLEHVYPIRITMQNNADRPIRIRYGDFRLRTATGRSTPALPPFRVEGEFLSPTLMMAPMGPVTPRFAYSGFYVAPYFAVVYPGVPIYRRPYLFYDPLYYGAWYPSFERAMRPTMEVLALALPEGILEPGGRVTGFLYFRPMERTSEDVMFLASLIAVSDGATVGGAWLGEVSIPLRVIRR